LKPGFAYVAVYAEAHGHLARLLGRCGAIPSLEMAADRVRVGYPQVSGPAGSGLGMVYHPRFSVSGLVSGSVFHPWISNGYPK
jgi:hypothetical protein